MNQLTNLSIHNILVLKTYLQLIFGDHYPFEIIQIINMLFYKLFNVSISCGCDHTYLVFDKESYVWGGNEYGQLGLGHNRNRNSPHKLNLPPIQKISCGTYYSIAITTTNGVYVWGANAFGELGLGHNQNLNSQQKLNLSPIKKISCGANHSVIIITTNEVYVWGANGSGQLGLGHNQDQNSPQKIDFLIAS